MDYWDRRLDQARSNGSFGPTEWRLHRIFAVCCALAVKASKGSLSFAIAVSSFAYWCKNTRFQCSPANAFRTSDWEIPNCSAMRDGVTPALKAARTAFNCPRVKEGGTSTCRLRELPSETGIFLQRRFCSASTAASNRSSS